MKKIFTLLFATLMATHMMAQMPGNMKFAGASDIQLKQMSLDIPVESDTLVFSMNGMTSGNLTFPTMQYAMQGSNMVIPSFEVKNVTFAMSAGVVTMAEQDFTATTTDATGAEKTVSGKLSGTYNMADNKMSVVADFKYGKMPFALTYSIDAYYIKAVTAAPLKVSVGGAYNYENANVVYNVRKYKDGDVEKVDVEIPTYTLEGTVMGNLTLGTYTVKGLTYDEEKGGYYRDYVNDGLKFHFTAENNGTKTMDDDYAFNAGSKNNMVNDILVKYEGTSVAGILNNFHMGVMPFQITSSFGNTTTGIASAKNDVTKKNDGKMYNLQGQQVGNDYKGVVIVNGKKFVKK